MLSSYCVRATQHNTTQQLYLRTVVVLDRYSINSSGTTTVVLLQPATTATVQDLSHERKASSSSTEFPCTGWLMTLKVQRAVTCDGEHTHTLTHTTAVECPFKLVQTMCDIVPTWTGATRRGSRPLFPDVRKWGLTKEPDRTREGGHAEQALPCNQ